MLGFEGEEIESIATFKRTMRAERINDSGDKLRRLEKSVSNCYRDFSFARRFVIRQLQLSPSSSNTCDIRLLNKRVHLLCECEIVIFRHHISV